MTETASQCGFRWMCYSPRRRFQHCPGRADLCNTRSTTTAVLQTLMAGLLAFYTVLPSAAQDANAAATVGRLHAALLDIMQNAQTLGFAGRRDRIAPVVRESFDLRFVTRFSLGRYWSDLNAEQRDVIVDVFSRWTIAHYASRFDGYSSERFETVSNEPARRGRELVRTVLRVSNDPADNVTLDYLLHKSDAKWRIVNVIANGVSDLSLKRADFGAVLKTQGLDSLIAKLESQISDLESGN